MTRIINAFFDVHTKLRAPPPMPTHPVRKYKALTKPVLRGPLMVVNIYIYILYIYILEGQPPSIPWEISLAWEIHERPVTPQQLLCTSDSP